MYKFVFSVLIPVLVAGPAVAEFDVRQTKNIRTECRNVEMRTYEVAAQDFSKTLYDTFVTEDGDKYISNSRTRISIWAAEPGLVTGCLSGADWVKKSDVAPKGVSVVYAAASCQFAKPSVERPVDVQVVYEAGFSRITTDGSDTVTKSFITEKAFLGNPNKFSKIDYQNYKSAPEGVDAPDCFNIDLK